MPDPFAALARSARKTSGVKRPSGFKPAGKVRKTSGKRGGGAGSGDKRNYGTVPD